eukprot:1160068-Pelagomonas_calceolata.AAC.8
MKSERARFKGSLKGEEKSVCLPTFALARIKGPTLPTWLVSIESALSARAPEVVQAVKRPLTW